jgi:F0F1-type ATP synthase assembly protein I
MPPTLPDPKEIGHYYALAQVGLEMVLPVVAGLLLDSRLGWQPWGVVVGAVLGLVAGLAHLIFLVDRWDKSRSAKRRQDKP